MTDVILDSTVSNSLQLFADKGFKLRVIMRLGNPWFVAPDACGCLALSNVSKALADLDDDDKLRLTRDEIDTLTSSEGIKCSVDSRVQSLNLVSESGLYDLIMQSRKPEAKAFKRWVTHEVLPSIRKTGGYGIRTVDDMINDPDTAIRLLTQLKIMRLQNKQLEMERDEAIRTKAEIGSRREATAMNTASQKSKECKRLTAENAELKEENVTLKDGWWSVSDVARMIARVCKLPRVYANDTLNRKCRIGLRYFAAKRNRMTRMLEVDGTHQDQYGNLVQNTAEHFDELTVADFREWVDENPEMFSKIHSVLVITMNDEKSENA